MKLFALLAVFLAVLASVFADKLQIDVKHKPDSCPPEKVVKSGDRIKVHYRGTLKDGGKEFDSSYSRNQPFTFNIGKGQVIKGWDQGLEGACIGEKRTLTIPPSLGYGASGAGGVIPPNAWLVFETEVVDIVSRKH